MRAAARFKTAQAAECHRAARAGILGASIATVVPPLNFGRSFSSGTLPPLERKRLVEDALHHWRTVLAARLPISAPWLRSWSFAAKGRDFQRIKP
jgi:hypothetical protein